MYNNNSNHSCVTYNHFEMDWWIGNSDRHLTTAKVVFIFLNYYIILLDFSLTLSFRDVNIAI